jgi:hypothetical protein
MAAYQVDKLLAMHERILVLTAQLQPSRGGPDAEPDPQLANPDIIIAHQPPESRYPKAAKLRLMLDGTSFMKDLDCVVM